MKILIAKPNKEIIQNYFPKVKFRESTANTITFNVGTKEFQKELPNIKADGYNPYSLMVW